MATPGFFHEIMEQFIQTSALEWFGTVTGFACVFLAARQHILNWPVSILSIIAFSALFYQHKLYGDAVLQVYFFGTAVYGWYYWSKRAAEHRKPVVRLDAGQMLMVCGVTVVLSLLLGGALDRFTDSDVPFADGACTAISFVAQFLMTRKVVQNWLLWILVDIAYIPLYLYKGLALTAVLYLVFAGIAYMGYKDWNRSWKENS